MTRKNIEGIYELAIPEIQTQADDITPHILAAAVEALKKTQDDEAGGKPKVTISHIVEIHLSTEPPSWKVKSAVSVRHVVESERQLLENKDQLKLPLE